MAAADAVKVLVVDDTAEMLGVLGEMLQIKGYTVLTSPSSIRALDIVQADRPHCVILDVLMPGMDGAAFARRLRRDHGDDIVLIAISGYPEDHPLVADAFAVVDHYLQKPFGFTEVDKVLPDVH